MNPGELNRIISIETATETLAAGRTSVTWGSPVSVRAKVTQIDGTRYLSEDELKDKAVYKFLLWDNGYSDNIRITYGTLVLTPIRPLTKNPGTANMNEVTIIAATKK